ncbi:MAG: adenosine deaminase [Candidatus Acidiferrum sp.]
MKPSSLLSRIASLPKAELHLHLEGSIRPAVACALSARHGFALSEDEVRRRYDYRNFTQFIEAFKWVTSFLREPRDFALLAADLAEQLLEQHVVYAEVTLSVGIMLLRKQDPQASFEAILAATEPFEKRGLRLNWIFDAVRQFGPGLALDVVEAARRCASPRIVAFGIGGDELSVPTREFKHVYARAKSCGLHLLIHAGEIGGPEKIREAVEVLGVERLGHGIAAIHDPALMDLLAERRIPLEVCPTSNLRTGALALQLHNPGATLQQHPLPQLLRHGIPIVLSTDDPAMFHASLGGEYELAAGMGLCEAELAALHRAGVEHAFLPKEMKQVYLARL